MVHIKAVIIPQRLLHKRKEELIVSELPIQEESQKKTL